MTWIKLDNRAVDHPKVAGLTDKAFRWWIRGLCYASAFLTDGILPRVFWGQIPKQVRAELTNARLWVFDDPDLRIHDYLGHQSSREAVDRKKALAADRVKRYRERSSNGVTDALRNAGSNAPVTPPDTDTDTENRYREQTTPSASRGGTLIPSPREYARLQETHAFVGSKLRVPKALHSELLTKSGGDAERALQAWYLDLNDRLEETDTGTGDVFTWLRPRHQSFAILKGWIEPAPRAEKTGPQPIRIQDILDREAAKKAGRAS